MAKTYGGRIRRTGRDAKKRTQRIVAKSRSITLAGRPGLNVSAAKSSRFFASMPPILRFKVPWYCDTAYNFALGQGAGAYLVFNAYWWIDPLRFDYPTNLAAPTVGTRGFYSSEMKGMFFQFQEARFRTHQLQYEFTPWINRASAGGTADEIALNSAPQPPVSIACAAVPLSYLRQGPGGAAHTPAQAGTVYAGSYDYYSVLTKTPGTREYTLTEGSRNKCSGSMIVDGYSHNGTIQSMTCTHTGWTEAAEQPTVIYNYPDPGVNRTVFLFCIRVPYIQTVNGAPRIQLRGAYRLDQHIEFIDKNPAFPYLSALPQNAA